MNTEHRAVTEIEAAEFLGLAVATLRAWRHRKKGPKFHRFGRAVRYLISDLEDFVRRSIVVPGDTTAQSA
jgi:predicted DNA-binding transcriptional regulator AlpA